MTDALQQCINYGGTSKSQRAWALLHPSLGIQPTVETLLKPCKAPRQQVHLEAYQGSNAQVLGLQGYLQKQVGNDLYAAVVHGSLATDDELNYSDFDALLILKDEVLQDPVRLKRVAKKLCKALRFLRKQDALQHHGWMLLSQCDLLNYDPNFLPLETLQCAKSLLGSPMDLEIAMSNGVGSKEFLEHLSQSILAKLYSSKLHESAYFLKALLSELMLVPAVAYQAKFNKGLYKRESFDLMQPYYEPMEWKAISTAAEIRALWPIYKSSAIDTLNALNPILASLVTKKKSWNIPAEIKEKLNDTFRQQVKQFLEKSNRIVQA